MNDDFHDTWISNGKRYYYGVQCNCQNGTGHDRCMDECEASFNDDLATLKTLHPED